MSWDCYTRLTLPTWALSLPAIAQAVHAGDSPIQEVKPQGDGTTMLAGLSRDGEFSEIEDALKDVGIAFDGFAEDPGDGSVETCIRRVFRPTAGGPPHEATIPVTRADVPVLPLDVWDTLAGSPGGSVTWAAVQQHLGLPADSIAAWSRQHAPASP